MIIFEGIVVNNEHIINGKKVLDGRVQVRLLGKDSFKNLKDEDLPWIEVLNPIDFAGYVNTNFFEESTNEKGGIGLSTFLKKGTIVYVGFIQPFNNFSNDFHKNSKNFSFNRPIVLGVVSSHYALNGLSSPTNEVKHSESGHLFEIDDTKGNERIHTKHRTGTETTYTPDGCIDVNIVKDNNISIKQNRNKTIEQNETIKITGNQTITIEGNRDIKIKGSDNLESETSITLKVGNSVIVVKDGKTTITVGGINAIIDNSLITLNGDVTINGNVNVSGSVAAASGFSGAGGGTATMLSGLDVKGMTTCSGDVIGLGKSLATHIHGNGNNGSPTTPPM